MYMKFSTAVVPKTNSDAIHAHENKKKNISTCKDLVDKNRKSTGYSVLSRSLNACMCAPHPRKLKIRQRKSLAVAHSLYGNFKST